MQPTVCVRVLQHPEADQTPPTQDRNCLCLFPLERGAGTSAPTQID